ncbi:MAG: nitrogenase iron-molybdenum cofactor biosynthesis protein NifE [Candidatus Aquicultor sp.]
MNNMQTSLNKLTETGCNVEKKDKLCRSRGGESCAFDGAMIVLQPIADTAHIVHGPITCAGNSWEGRGSLSSKGDLHRMGFTTDMNEMDIVYGSDEKLFNAIIETYHSVKPKAIFVYVTCVSGLIGEDIEAICTKAEAFLNSQVRVIPVNAPGFVGPKNLGNRIAGEVLLDHVIGTGEPEVTTDYDINLIGEYNIAGDLWLIEQVLEAAGIRVLSRITGDAAYEEITHAHRARLNVVVCSRALINVAKEMERTYGIPYVEVSFFGKTEMSKALRAIASELAEQNPQLPILDNVEAVIERQEEMFARRVQTYNHLKGKRAVLYTGGVRSWSLISALRDLGIEIVAVGTKKSTFEDEQKMRGLLGAGAPLVEDVAAKNLLALIREGEADMLIAGGRNQYLAMKEAIPFVDVNQERHIAYAGYSGLIQLAEQIANSMKFFDIQSSTTNTSCGARNVEEVPHGSQTLTQPVPRTTNILINPLKHSPSIGAAIAL